MTPSPSNTREKHSPNTGEKSFLEEAQDEANAFNKEHHGVTKPSQQEIPKPKFISQYKERVKDFGKALEDEYPPVQPPKSSEWEKELYMLIGRFDSTTGYYLGLKEFDIYLIISFIKSLLKEERERIKKELQTYSQK